MSKQINHLPFFKNPAFYCFLLAAIMLGVLIHETITHRSKPQPLHCETPVWAAGSEICEAR